MLEVLTDYSRILAQEIPRTEEPGRLAKEPNMTQHEPEGQDDSGDFVECLQV